MGIRPSKYIGWVIETTPHELNDAAFDTLIRASYRSKITPEYTYQKFYDFLEDHPVGELVQRYAAYSSSLDQYNPLTYMDIVQNGVDGISEDKVYFVFYPMMLMPYAFPDDPKGGTDDFRDEESAFVYAELEQFFPEAFENLSSCSYTVEAPVFPSDYSVIYRAPETVQDFSPYTNYEYRQDIYRVLRQLQRGETDKAEQFVKLTGFASVEDLTSQLRLAPPEELFMFAQFLNVFNDESIPYRMKPTVVYSWK